MTTSLGPACARRLAKEFAAFAKDKDATYRIEPVSEDNLLKLVGKFAGAKDTPYHGGEFELDITLEPNYPFTVPRAKFVTPVFHPNISSQTGSICLDVLQGEWSPVMGLRGLLMSVQSLLETPNPDSPLDGVVNRVYTTDRKKYTHMVAFWTHVFASPLPTAKPTADALAAVLPLLDSPVAPELESDPTRPITVSDIQSFGLQASTVTSVVEHGWSVRQACVGLRRAKAMGKASEVVFACEWLEERAAKALLAAPPVVVEAVTAATTDDTKATEKVKEEEPTAAAAPAPTITKKDQ
ncbi:ubiquitin-conjugating enzyme/RWD-like protein [Blastocladiella britannica]|nr:ubiquitin-conjugating enzyme/RWD-like protein [Blastocladiella britannica]